MHSVFVYGTLKSGKSNHKCLEGSAFLMKATARGILLDNGWYPMMIPGDGVVHGEVYKVDDSTMARLDRLEGHPHVYRRERITLLDPKVTVWTYLWTGDRTFPVVNDGVWQGCYSV